MSRITPTADRITQARALIQKARELLVPADDGKNNFSYIARVKGHLQRARDLVKFIPMTRNATPEMKEEVKKIFAEADQANQEILH